jgi:uncharacterized protein (TIRG00374 family)
MRRLLRGALLVASVGLALHLVLPQIPGLERSARLLAGASHALVVAAFAAELLSEFCYAELLGRSVGIATGRRRGIGRWFAFRLTMTGYGASHVLPGGGATAATVTYAALRRRGLDNKEAGLALAAVSLPVYGVLTALFCAGLLYLLLFANLGPIARAASALFLALTVAGAMGAYASYRRPAAVRRLARAGLGLLARALGGGRRLSRAEDWSARTVGSLREEFRATGRQLGGRPRKALGFGVLALGYWGFDALCMLLVFGALGVTASPFVLLAGYGIATMLALVPLTPGGIGVFEATMLATVALLGVGSEAAIPILGYRLFNFWMPIPLAAIFYPTLGRGVRKPG